MNRFWVRPCTIGLFAICASLFLAVVHSSPPLFAQASAITSFSPTSGPVGTTVTVQMTQNPSSVTSVVSASVNGINATILNNSRPAAGQISLQLVVPAGATTGPIRVVTYNSVIQANETATSTTPFTVGTQTVSTITSFSPTSGPAGTLVTVTGTGFTGVTSANFRGTVIPVNVAASGISATFTVPGTVGSGAAAFSFNLPNGMLAIAPTTFTVTAPPAPTITSFSPASGARGSTITITGTNFTGATFVGLGGFPMQFTVNPAGTSITATIPATFGFSSGGITVATPGGQTQSTSVFTVTTPPFLAGFSPTSARPKSIVRIFTSQFTLVRSISLNGAAVPLVSYGSGPRSATNPTEFFTEFRVPVGAQSGTLSVVMARLDGNTLTDYTLTTTATFTVLPLQASISSVSPVAGFAGTSVTLKGEGFTGATAVRIGGVAVPNFTVQSDEAITLTAGNTSGLIEATTPVNATASTVSFNVLIPPATITNFTPTSGGAGTVVTITGTNLAGASNVSFGAFAASNVVVSPNGTSITATVGAQGGTGSISLQTPAGFVSSSTNFTFTPPPPSITSVSPVTARAGEVTTFTIQGANLLGITSADLAGQPAAVGINTATQVVVSMTPQNVGTSPMVVINANGTASTMNITVQPALPVVTGISPSKARTGDVVTVFGSNFTGATAVTLGGTPAQIQSNNGAQITATVGNGASGAVSVTTPAGQGSGAAFTFDASAPPPVITALSPTSGNAGTQVTITGTNLPTSGVQVLVGASVGHTVVSASPSAIVFTLANTASIGAASVQAFNASVSANSTPLTFSVTAPATLAPPTLVSPANNASFPSQTGADAEVSVTLQWSAVQGATSYERQIEANSGFANATTTPMNGTSSIRTISRPTAGSPDAVRYWRIRAVNAATGAVSPWSETRSFTVPSLPVITSIAPSVATQGTVVVCTIQGAGTDFTKASGVQLKQGVATIAGTILPGPGGAQMLASFTIPANAALGFYDVVVQNAPIPLTRTNAVSVVSASEALPDETVESGFKVKVHGWGVSNNNGGNILNAADYANVNYSSAQYPQTVRDRAASLGNDLFTSFDEFIFGFSRYGNAPPFGTVSIGGVVQPKYADEWLAKVDTKFFRRVSDFDGVCAGYARVALLNYAGESVYQFPQNPFDYKTSLAGNKSIQKLILSHWAYQESGRSKQDVYDILDEVAYIRSSFKSGDKNKQPIISIQNLGGGGHQVVPFRITATKINGAIIDSIYVYDPNHPGDEGKAILVNRNDKTWQYPPLINNKYNFSGSGGKGFRWVAPSSGLVKFSVKPTQTLANEETDKNIAVSFNSSFVDGAGTERLSSIRTVNASNQVISNTGAEADQPTIPGATLETLESGAPPNFRSVVTGFTLPEVSGQERLTTSYRAASIAQTNRFSVSGQGAYLSASWLASATTPAQTLATNTEQASILLASEQAASSVSVGAYGEEKTVEGARTGRFNSVSLVNTTLGANAGVSSGATDSLAVQFADNFTKPVIDGGAGTGTYTLRLQQGAASREFRGIGMLPYERHQVLVSSWANLASATVFLVVSGRTSPTRVVPLTASGTVGVRQAAQTDGFGGTLQIAPNPASESATLRFTALSGGEDVEITVSTLLGQTVGRKYQRITQSGFQHITLETSNYPQGAYIVSVKYGSLLFSAPLVVAR